MHCETLENQSAKFTIVLCLGSVHGATGVTIHVPFMCLHSSGPCLICSTGDNLSFLSPSQTLCVSLLKRVIDLSCSKSEKQAMISKLSEEDTSHLTVQFSSMTSRPRLALPLITSPRFKDGASPPSTKGSLSPSSPRSPSFFSDSRCSSPRLSSEAKKDGKDRSSQVTQDVQYVESLLVL